MMHLPESILALDTGDRSCSMLLYSLLYLTGYGLPLDKLKRFRQ
jgi:transketolase